MLACRVLGHRPRYRAEAATMRWECARGCGMTGSKCYPTAEHAGRFAAALNRVDRAALGRRPLLSLMPLALLDRARRAR